MKKYIAALLSFAMIFALCACGGQQASVAENSLDLLEKVWETYGADEKFPAAGGDFTDENMTMDAPGNFGIEDKTALDTSLGLPSSAADLIDNAASLTHMMNVNTFTAAAFRLTDAANADTVVKAISDNLMNRQWMCGFPDELVIITVGDYVISFFGKEDLTDTFEDKVLACFEGAEVVFDEDLIDDDIELPPEL